MATIQDLNAFSWQLQMEAQQFLARYYGKDAANKSWTDEADFASMNMRLAGYDQFSPREVALSDLMACIFRIAKRSTTIDKRSLHVEALSQLMMFLLLDAHADAEEPELPDDLLHILYVKAQKPKAENDAAPPEAGNELMADK